MSIIRYTTLSLSEIIEASNLIVEIQYLDHYDEIVPIKNKPGDQTIPPFIKKGFIFNIKTVLKNSSGINVPPTIRVPNEDWRRKLSQHKQLYDNGASKSYSLKKYETSASSARKASILFLYHFQDMFEFTAKDAYESAAAREKITMLLSS
jgi:hypothetical protein